MINQKLVALLFSMSNPKACLCWVDAYFKSNYSLYQINYFILSMAKYMYPIMKFTYTIDWLKIPMS